MKKIYFVEVSFDEQNLEDYHLNELNEEIIKQDKEYIFTNSKVFLFKKNHLTAEDIHTKIKPDKTSFVDDNGIVNHVYSLIFIYEDYEEAIMKDKKKIVRDIVTLDIREKLHKKANELIHEVNQLDAFMLYGIK
jgi:hypothetical protein